MAPKVTPTVNINLRLPKARHRELTRAAKRNKTSLNAEMLRRLAYDADVADREYQFEWIAHTVKAIWDKLNRADANGQQAATWSTPKSWAEAQKRPPSQERS